MEGLATVFALFSSGNDKLSDPPPPTPHHVLFLSAASSFIPPVTGSGEGRLD